MTIFGWRLQWLPHASRVLRWGNARIGSDVVEVLRIWRSWCLVRKSHLTLRDYK